MSDYYLTKFWNDIKDPDWPGISTWNDFHTVAWQIKEECFGQHGLQERLDEIENPDYWLLHSLPTMFKKDRFVFINVPKCGSIHYEDFFVNRLGWENFYLRSLDEMKNYVAFGLMMHPLDRYIKGLTQFVWPSDLDNQHLKNFVTSCFIPDVHAVSYSWYFNELLSDIHWIPFQGMPDNEVKSCMNKLFVHYDSKLEIPINHPAMHVSSKEQKILHQKILSHWLQRNEPKPEDRFSDGYNSNLYLVYRAYAQDLKFYRQLKTVFTPDWSHLKPHLA